MQAKKEPPPELLARKEELDASIRELDAREQDAEAALRIRAGRIGNIVHPSVPVSMDEVGCWPSVCAASAESEDDQVDNGLIRTWHPQGPNATPEKRTDILAHDLVMDRLDMLDQERGVKVAGHRGFFLMNDGIDLNQALISYGLDFLRQHGYKKVMTPFMMRKTHMSKTAQLEDFDEALYRVGHRPVLVLPAVSPERARRSFLATGRTTST